MSVREQLDLSQPATDRTLPITLISPPNWTYVFFFAVLGTLHLCVAVPAFTHQRWEGYVSAVLAIAFLATSVVMFHARCEVIFDSPHRRIRVRSGVGRFHFQRWISFDDVHAVRLTISSSDRPRSRVEVLCDNEDIECPPSDSPRQEALCLAMLMNVQLIKVWADSKAEERAVRL